MFKLHKTSISVRWVMKIKDFISFSLPINYYLFLNFYLNFYCICYFIILYVHPQLCIAEVVNMHLIYCHIGTNIYVKKVV